MPYVPNLLNLRKTELRDVCVRNKINEKMEGKEPRQKIGLLFRIDGGAQH